VACAAFLCACEDTAGLVGPSIQPDGDKAIIYTDTFQLEASTIQLDSVYAKSTEGLLGELHDPMFGDLKSDYLCQFYSEDSFKFAHTPYQGKIDSATISIFYDRGSWMGDSLAPMQLTVYPVVKQLPAHFYTNLNPADYADMAHPLGQAAYTPKPMNVSDSIWQLASTDDNYYYTYVRVMLPTSLGQKFYDESVNNPSSFVSQQAFNNFFPGIYVTNTFGSGNMISVSETRMNIYYRYLTESSSGAVDSLVNASEIFAVASDIIQLNSFRNTNVSQLLQPNDKYTYMKTPSGICTRITLPLKEIFDKEKGRNFNNAYLSLKAMPPENWAYASTLPSNLLLLPEDTLPSFFRNEQLANSVTSYLATYDGSNGQPTYSFGNLSALLKAYRDNYPNMEKLNLIVLPVSVSSSTDSYYGTTTITAVDNYMRPSGVEIRKDPGQMSFQVITSKYQSQNQ
jgi:hypothetical protein